MTWNRTYDEFSRFIIIFQKPTKSQVIPLFSHVFSLQSSHPILPDFPGACMGDQPGANDLADQSGQVGGHQIHLGLVLRQATQEVKENAGMREGKHGGVMRGKYV
jgi:hypothetical protein